MTTTGEAAFAPRPIGVDWALWRGRWALGWMLLCATIVGPLGYAGQLGYAALIGVAGIAALPMLGLKRAPVFGVAVLLALALWCCIATGWSPAAPTHLDLHRYKNLEGVTALKLVLEVALYSAFVMAMREVPSAWAGRITTIVAISVTACALAMTIDALTHQALYRFFRLAAHAADNAALLRRNAARGCYTVALLFWPAAIWMRRRGWNLALLALTLGFFVSSIGLAVDAPMVAVVLGGLAFEAVRRFGRRAVWVLLALTVIYFALAPLNTQLAGPFLPHSMMDPEGAKASWGARAEIWRFAAAEAAGHPWLGVGMDSSRVFAKIPLHPHNAALQIWMELGVVGAALATLFWAWLWSRIGTEVETSASRAGAGAAMAVAYLTFGALSFGVWQEWWLALGALGLAIHHVFGVALAAQPGRSSDALAPLVPLG